VVLGRAGRRLLISRRHDGLWLVTQPEHAALAGRLATQWGNEQFSLGPSTASLVRAAARHDDGWTVLDGAPLIAADEGRPAHFLEVPLAKTVGPYGEGVDLIYEDDVYAGVLASLHWAGLYMSRWGVQDSPPVEHPLAREVVADQERRIAPHLRELWAGNGLRSAFEAAVWRDYELLQALDLVSLALCLLDARSPTSAGADDIPVPATLREIDQPAGGRLIPNVPERGGAHVTLRLRVVAPDVVLVDPFPLTTSGVQFEVQARRMPDERFPTVDSAAAAYHDAEIVGLALTLISPDDAESAR
jgi:uncharacterized protein DUF3891